MSHEGHMATTRLTRSPDSPPAQKNPATPMPHVPCDPVLMRYRNHNGEAFELTYESVELAYANAQQLVALGNAEMYSIRVYEDTYARIRTEVSFDPKPGSVNAPLVRTR